MNKIARIFLFLIAPFLITAASGLAQSEQSVEQIKKQIDDLKSRGANNASWSPAVKSAYDASLSALIAAYNEAIDGEIRQLNELLEVVSNQSARKPLEDQISRLNIAKQQAPAPNNAPQTVITTNGDRAGEPTGLAAPNNAPQTAIIPIEAANAGNGSNGGGSSSPGAGASLANGNDDFTIEVHARVKGTGYPVKFAHVKLLRLKPDSNTSEYVDASDFKCRSKCNTDWNGFLSLTIPASDNIFKIAIQKDPYHPFVQPDVILPRRAGQAVVNAELIPRDDEYYRSILGIEQTGLSAGRSDQNVFLNLFVSRPILSVPYYTEPGRTNCRREEKNEDPEVSSNPGSSRTASKPLGEKKDNNQNIDNNYTCDPPRHRIWGDFRITSVPQPNQNLFQSLNGSFGGAVNSGIDRIRDLYTGFSFLAGYQYKLTRGSIAGNRFDFSIIVGGGASSVLSAEKNAPIYKIPGSEDPERRRLLENKLRGLTDDRGVPFDPSRLAGYAHIAFVTKERDRFLRSYYGGFRFETHYGDTAPSRPSGMFDVLFGQDESVTGGRLQGSVLRLDGFFPLSIGKGNLVYLFGTSQLGLKRSKTNDPLLLPQADSTQTLTSPTTLVVPVPAANRDLYRIGVGVNLFQVFSAGNRN